MNSRLHVVQMAHRVHEDWILSKAAQGFHSPSMCPCHSDSDAYQRRTAPICPRCDPGLYPFSELPEDRQEHYYGIITRLEALITPSAKKMPPNKPSFSLKSVIP